MFVVNGLICQNAVIRRTTSAARYSSTNQARGGVSRIVARAHGRRHSAAETRDQIPPRGGAAAVTATRGHLSYSMIWVHDLPYVRARNPDHGRLAPGAVPRPGCDRQGSFDLGVPCRHPLGVRDAVMLAVVAGRDRGL